LLLPDNSAATSFTAADGHPIGEEPKFCVGNSLGTGLTVIASASLLIFSPTELAG
jgi:hypothetical protein